MTPTAVNNPNPSRLEYMIREPVAYLTIWSNIKNPDSYAFPSGQNSYELWSHLQQEYQAVSPLARQRKEDAFNSCRYTGGKITGEGGYVEKFRQLRKEATDFGAVISETQFLTKFIDSFPRTPEWNIITGNLLGETNFNVAANRLQEYVRLQTGGDGTNTTGLDSIAAVQAEVKQLQAQLANVQSNGNRMRRGPANPDLKCTNPNCKGVGYVIDDCFKLGGGKQGQYPKWWKGKRDAPLPSANNTTTSEPKYFALSSEILVAKNLSSTNHLSNNRILADTGATNHFFHDRDAFITYVSEKGSLGSSSRKGTNFEIVGRGDVRIHIIHKGTEHILTLRNVLHAPEISSNLISIGTLDAQGYFMTIGGGRIVIMTAKKEEVMEGKLTDGLYIINNATIVHIPVVQTMTAAFLTQRDVLEHKLWHRRGGHINNDRISKGSKLLDGLKLTTYRVRLPRCEPCILAKSKKEPYPDSTEVVTDPLDLWVLDIWGPSRIPSVGGCLYAMVVVDAGTAKRMSDCLKNRTAETTLQSLNEMKTVAERQTNHRLKRIRTDNAPEFRSNLWIDWFKQHGIIHEFSATYSSSSNGLAECAIGILTAATRTLLNEANLGGRWWASAWMAATYVGNLFPSSHGNEIPEEKWTGKKQNVDHLRVWGCIAYVHIPAEHGHSKLDVRAIKCQFVGYEGRGAKLFKVDGSDEVIRSRDAVFVEGEGRWASEVEGESEDLSFLVPTPKAALPSLPQSHDSSSDTSGLASPEPPSTPPHQIKAHDIIPPVPAAPRAPRTRPTQAEIWGNEPTRRSTRTGDISQRLIQSREYQEREAEAERRGEDWTTEYPILPEIDEEVDTPAAHEAKTESFILEPENTWVPSSYGEAMQRPDLWCNDPQTSKSLRCDGYMHCDWTETEK
ncbi:hypothetical protein D9758_016454 [Tetrapyrgos nigripes]|uniref:Integrase catalytic domain-containing protein n=1 Tax=Tetrapyrgos nigripes TaxID=182062 RepID=A0A8H5CC87_9AGAR|nr:hypothetical protein D9758_016454 [Tetrapyrgos nigripes]